MFEHNKEQQKELLELQAQHPDKRVVLIAEKGTMGVGSSECLVLIMLHYG